MKVPTTTTATLLTVVALLLLPVPAAAGDAPSGACEEPSGVTVVVDFTDLGGSVQSGCAATGFDTGRAALESAGFTITDSQPGLICAINSQPEPCPETFQGSFWSYWHAAPDGEWMSYQVGADSSSPVAGQVEGWLYNDGSAAPGIAPPAAQADAPAADLQDDAPEAVQAGNTQDGTAALVAVAIVVVAGLGLGGWWFARKRSAPRRR